MTKRGRSPHPGVVLLKPDPAYRHPHWRARYTDPTSGRMVKITLTYLTTAEARRAWAIRKAKSLAFQRGPITEPHELERIIGPDWRAVVSILATLRELPDREARMNVLAHVVHAYCRHPNLRPE